MKHSEKMNEIVAALVEFEKEISPIQKDMVNPHFKNHYSSLDAITEIVRPLLAKNGLVLVQGGVESANPEYVALESTIFHTSGQWISGTFHCKPSKNDPQGVGAAITYLRRYSYSMLGVVSDTDDDGNSASGIKTDSPKKVVEFPNSAPLENGRMMSEAQRTRFFAICKGNGLTNEQIKRMMKEQIGIESTKDMTVEQMEKILTIANDPQAVAAMKINWAKIDLGG